MKVLRKSIKIPTSKRMEWIEITKKIQEVVKESKIKEGMVFVNSIHNTAAITIQENSSDIHRDMNNFLEKILPLDGKYNHIEEGPENATAHLKTNLLSSDLTIPLENGKLVLGTWQDIFFVELFEPRNREVVVTIIGE